MGLSGLSITGTPLPRVRMSPRAASELDDLRASVEQLRVQLNLTKAKVKRMQVDRSNQAKRMLAVEARLAQIATGVDLADDGPPRDLLALRSALVARAGVSTKIFAGPSREAALYRLRAEFVAAAVDAGFAMPHISLALGHRTASTMQRLLAQGYALRKAARVAE
jgi:hypothetical protein